MKILFVSSGNNLSNCPIAINQANSIKKYDNTIIIEHFRIVGKGIFGYLTNIKSLKKKIKEFDPDIIHSHYSFSGYLSILANRKVPIIASLMGSDVQLSGFWRNVLRTFSLKWKNIIVKSEIMRSKCGIHRALVIPNGVDVSSFPPIQMDVARSKLKLKQNIKYILFLADPTRSEKNFALAKESFALLNDNNTELLVAYNVPFEDTKYYYYASDVVLMTSKYEGSPNVIKEAMACNKPIVCTRVGDVETLLDGLKGCYIAEQNAVNIADNLKKALEFKAPTEGKNRLIQLGIDSDSIAKRIVQLYSETLGLPTEKPKAVYKICSKGVWDSSVPGIKFNEQGVSNYCLLQEKMMRDYPRGEEGKKIWENIVTKIKSAGINKKYDCIVGVSGGVDSSYLLPLAKLSGLKPLAVHLDNGFNSEIAVANIEKITSALNIDLMTHVINYEEIKDLFRSYISASLPWIDAPTDLAIKALMYKIANKEGIKFILRGNDFRSEGKQPTDWTYSDIKQLKYLHKFFGSGTKLKTYPMLSLPKMVYYGFICKIKDIRPYYYIEYKKSDAKRHLMEKYGWQYYGGHHHENLFTKFTMSYWLPKKFDIDKRKINLSAQILSGEITRDEALDQLKQPFDSIENLEHEREYVCKKLNITQDEFQSLFKLPNKKFTDYPSSYNFIYNNIGYAKWLIKALYGFKPMSLDSNEMIK